MKEFRVPGLVWALLIVVGIGMIHEYEASLPFNAMTADAIVVILIGILKSLALGTGQLEQALNVIDTLRFSSASRQVRGTAEVPAGSEEMPHEEAMIATEIPSRPNKLAAFLVG